MHHIFDIKIEICNDINLPTKLYTYNLDGNITTENYIHIYKENIRFTVLK
jgi:hypothetical protein